MTRSCKRHSNVGKTGLNYFPKMKRSRKHILLRLQRCFRRRERGGYCADGMALFCRPSLKILVMALPEFSNAAKGESPPMVLRPWITVMIMTGY